MEVLYMKKMEIEAEEVVYNALFSILKLLGNANRFKIIKMLEDNRMTFNQIVYELKISPKTVSAHIKKLIAAGLIKKADQGYALTKAPKAILNLSINEMIEIIRELNNLDPDQQEEFLIGAIRRIEDTK